MREDEFPLCAREAKAKGEFHVEEFPYKQTRLQYIDYEEIIRIGEPWSDPTFPHGPQALFINGEKHQGHDKWNHVAKQSFYWRRASEHFKE